MYECPNCGGNMKFHIPTQQLRCDQCQSEMDPYAYSKEHDAESSTMYDATIFTCPQCGGEIIGSETSAAEFCSFCGASTILSSRLSKKRRPNYIIPFKKTKDDCKKSYSALMKKAFFAPKELKDERFIDSFRAIYIPYWAYHIDQNGSIILNGQKHFRRGDYIYTDHYQMGCVVTAYYKGMSYDASSSFDDTISQCIAPYDVRGMKEFTPSILSGFYADISDVDCNIYIEDAQFFANNNTFDAIKKAPAFSGVSITTPATNASLNNTLHTTCQAIDSTMFPVYFMSYRKGGRVAYAIVNGQTGKATADIPVDTGKYFLFSLLMALPIFLLLNLMFTVKATTVISVAAILSLITQIIYISELSKINKKEMRLDDKGYQYANGVVNFANNTIKPKKIKQKNSPAKIAIIVIFCAAFCVPILGTLTAFGGLILPAAVIASLVIMIIGLRRYIKLSSKRGFPTFVFSFAAVLICGVIKLVSPVSDIWYYSCALLILVSVLANNIGIINKYNVLATRKLPQFNRHGGDDRA